MLIFRHFRQLTRAAVWCIGLGLAWSATCHASPVLYGITQGDTLIRINTSTGAGTLVGGLTTSMSAIGLAQTGGNLYAFDTNGGNVLQQIDPATAATVTTVPVGFTSLDTLGEGDLAFNSGGTGYVVSSLLADGSFGGGSLFSLNLAGNSHTLVADNTPQLFAGLAFSPTNILYALTVDGSALYRVNAGTGIATLVGNTGISDPTAAFGGLSFRSDGALFATVGDFSNDSMLYSINPASGAASLIGDTGSQAVSGIAFIGSVTTSGVPEPSTGLLMLVVPFALAAGRKFKTGRQK